MHTIRIHKPTNGSINFEYDFETGRKEQIATHIDDIDPDEEVWTVRIDDHDYEMSREKNWNRVVAILFLAYGAEQARNILIELGFIFETSPDGTRKTAMLETYEFIIEQPPEWFLTHHYKPIRQEARKRYETAHNI